ncbi:hypothetical protein FP2506_06901 [Fulvimarina pelagi HTCC2506]|uniref:Uncharacterized protein n=1 Tax=Fulvimarina pelagi HTCC2506 TaxID=314231 RepID=Q0G716_9HYPH|nr:hypothetical protein FP2506_06901 [Fulvimarina pelagi HTCC2506]
MSEENMTDRFARASVEPVHSLTDRFVSTAPTR